MRNRKQVRNLLYKVYFGYAFEAVFANSKFGQFGLEDVEEEVMEADEKFENGEFDDDFPTEEGNSFEEAFDITEDEEGSTEEQPVPEPEDTKLPEAPVEDEAPSEEPTENTEEEATPTEEEFKSDAGNKEDAEVEEDLPEDNGEYHALDKSFFQSPGEWEEVNIDDLKSDAESINMIKIIATFNNSYVGNMEAIYKRNPGKVEHSGDFTKSELFKFVDDGVKTIQVVFQNDKEAVKELEELYRLLRDVPKMKAVCGNEKTPFIYEGIQLLVLELVRTYLALIPFHLRDNKTLIELLVDMDLKVVKTLREIASDIIEVSNLFGSRIYFIAPIDSDTTGKSEELANTEYAMLPELQSQGGTMNYSGESVMNLIQIKNQNALPEYSLIAKMLQIVSSLSRDIDLEKTCLDLVEGIKDLLLSSGAEEKVNKYCDIFRQIVIIPQIEAFARMVSDEQKKLTNI